MIRKKWSAVLCALFLLLSFPVCGFAAENEPDLAFNPLPAGTTLSSGKEYAFYFTAADGSALPADFSERYTLRAELSPNMEYDYFSDVSVRQSEDGRLYLRLVPADTEAFAGFKKADIRVSCTDSDGRTVTRSFKVKLRFEVYQIENETTTIASGERTLDIRSEDELYLTRASGSVGVDPDLEEAEFQFENGVSFRVRLGERRFFWLYADTSCPYKLRRELVAAGVSFDILHFPHPARFDYPGTMRIPSPYSRVFQYQDGILTELDTVYENGVHTFQAQLLSCFILTD